MDASIAVTDEEQEDSGNNAGSELRGMRKRWAGKRPSDSLSDLPSHNSDAEEDPLEETNATQHKRSRSSANNIAVDVQDSACDEAQGDCVLQLPATSSSGHAYEREALLHTNTAVFRFPWEKGRLSAIFC